METKKTKLKAFKTFFTATLTMIGILFLPATVLAQEDVNHLNFENETRLGIGLDLGLPTQDEYDFVIGGVVNWEMDVSETFATNLSAGYTNFSLDDEIESLDNVGFIPVKLGVKIFPSRPFYFSAEAGAAFNTTDEALGTAFTYSGGVGFLLNNGLDLSLRFEDYVRDVADPSQFALRIAYNFDLE